MRLRGVELVERAITAARAQTFDVEDILDGKSSASQWLLGGFGEVKSRGNGDTDGRCTINVGRELCEAAISVGDRAVQERLLLIAV